MNEITLSQSTETAVFAGGCFWCMEAVFSLLEGVVSIEPGYTGGTIENPTYDDVCIGRTGHAEAIRIVFDPSIIPYKELLSIFFSAHNPTSLNSQGPDVGTQYRSAIFYTTDLQKDIALSYVQHLSTFDPFEKPIVTEIVKLSHFYPAEPYHHQYFQKNPQQMYCQISIQPKVEKIREKHSSLLKKTDN
ncbi:MAG: peptide-methionine (S)-S-oxide reductase MsrA [Caldisericia bacterium]|nr:peptide-methionine (S)-S-oxide reductase MsrA [Caldisericia bacterium]MDD4615488.1 peptide-methionine (S)-S-oxide reductase MsrA [Caldisericia bacterium]